MSKLSAVLIAKDAEMTIGKTLESLNFCDEILVVLDASSTDKTEEICQSYQCKIFVNDFVGFGEQKNFAVSKAEHDFILSIDADEVVTEELGRSLKAILECGLDPKDVIQVLRRNEFLSKFIQKDVITRVFHRKYSSFNLNKVHEKVEFVGQRILAKGFLEHYPYENLFHYFGKLNIYTDFGAKENFKKGKKRYPFFLPCVFFLNFFKFYLLKGFFLRGHAGLIWSLCSGFSSFMKAAKLYELHLKRDIKREDKRSKA